MCTTRLLLLLFKSIKTPIQYIVQHQYATKDDLTNPPCYLASRRHSDCKALELCVLTCEDLPFRFCKVPSTHANTHTFPHSLELFSTGVFCCIPMFACLNWFSPVRLCCLRATFSTLRRVKWCSCLVYVASNCVHCSVEMKTTQKRAPWSCAMMTVRLLRSLHFFLHHDTIGVSGKKKLIKM